MNRAEQTSEFRQQASTAEAPLLGAFIRVTPIINRVHSSESHPSSHSVTETLAYNLLCTPQNILTHLLRALEHCIGSTPSSRVFQSRHQDGPHPISCCDLSAYKDELRHSEPPGCYKTSSITQKRQSIPAQDERQCNRRAAPECKSESKAKAMKLRQKRWSFT